MYIRTNEMRRSCFVCFGALSLTLVVGLPAARQQAAERSDRIHTQNAAEAGADFLIQGEYVGRLDRGKGPEMFGVHVIARGAGQFIAVGYPGGLPGAGWDEKTKLHFEGGTSGAQTVLRPKGYGASSYSLSIDSSGLQIVSAKGAVAGRLEHVVRRSRTLGQPAPRKARVLFDGTSNEHFECRKEGQPVEIHPEGFLRLTRGTGGLFTKDSFGDCFLHLEFRLPFEPAGRGQGRGNSGCYLQGRYEVQILDSFGLAGKVDEAGCIYKVADPRVNMCFPPLSWQTYDIDFKQARFDAANKKVANARMTVYHNGVLIHDDQEIAKEFTVAAPTTEEQSADKRHYLQDHGHEILFKNVWILEK